MEKNLELLLSRQISLTRTELRENAELFKGNERILEYAIKNLQELNNCLLGTSKKVEKKPIAEKDTIESTLIILVSYGLITEERYTSDMEVVDKVRGIDNLRHLLDQETFIETLKRVQSKNIKEGIKDPINFTLKCLHKERESKGIKYVK